MKKLWNIAKFLKEKSCVGHGHQPAAVFQPGKTGGHFFAAVVAAGVSLGMMWRLFLPAQAEPVDYRALAEGNKLMTVESNEIAGWPQGPAVSAKSAILVEANTGTVLYEKNVHERLYPASTTKILTAYIARQHSALDETVEYSAEAINSINWWEDANIGIRIGESLTMEQSLYALMVGSANECANAIGEHVSGSIPAFVDLMNQTAQELGCVDSHFVTTNGRHDDEHYTTAYDLMLIARQYFNDELLCKMSSTPVYIMPEGPGLSRELTASSKNALLPGKDYAYEYLVGSKTGYTGIARQSLVSCAEKDGLKLICVVMQDESPLQFADTVSLFNYGFSNFNATNAAEHDTTYSVKNNSSFITEGNIFGNNEPILFIDPDARVVLPANLSLSEVSSTLTYDGLTGNQAALIHYSYQGQTLGTAPILFSQNTAVFDFNADPAQDGQAENSGGILARLRSLLPSGTSQATVKNSDILLLDVRRVGIAAACLIAVVLILLITYKVLHNRRLKKRRQSIMNRKRRRSNIIDFDRYTNDRF